MIGGFGRPPSPNASKGPIGTGPINGNHGPKGMMVGMGTIEKPKNYKKTLKIFLRYLAPYRWSLVFVLFFAVFGTVFSIVGPKILGQATTILFEGVMAKALHAPGAAIDFNSIGVIVLKLVGLYLISAIFNYIQGYIMSGIAMKVTYNFRKNIVEKIKRLPLRYFDTQTHGELQSRVTNDVDTISATLTQNLSQLVTSATMIIGILYMMFTISWKMTLLAMVTLPLSFLLISLVIKYSQKYFTKQQEYLGHVNGHVEEMYSGHVIMKAFNGEAKSVQKFDQLNEELYKASWKSQFLSGMMFPIMMFVSNLSYVLVSILGGYLAVQGKINVGDILAFIQYVRSFMMPITQTANIANVLQSTAAAAERVFELLDEPEEIPDPENPVVPALVEGNVVFKNVRFGYNPDKIIIKDFSVNVKPGQKVAIVGPTGGGKTTLVKLLMRFYDLNSGTIEIDGVNITRFKREDLRNMFGMVLQDTWLFNSTIRENIRYGCLQATDAEVIAASKMANVDHFVRTLPYGYDLELNEESSNISQGQKQLLTIARAFLADPKILILDEATSSVDTRTELLIQKAMGGLMKGRTSFVIAHRLSTIRDADLILVINEGDIVEQGTHEELLADGGFYALLYNSQFAPSPIDLDVVKEPE